jgi:chromosome partitioning protein
VRVFAVYNIKGGVGKTASAVNLAWLAAQDGQRTLLWDLDPQGAASYTFRIKPGVKGGGKGLMRDRDAVLSSIKSTDFENLDMLPADFSNRDLDLMLDKEGEGKRRLSRVLAPLARHYDNVFIDCAPGISRVSEHIFASTDILLVPSIPTVLSLRTLSRLLKHFRQTGRRPERVLPFFCMVDRRKVLHRKVIDWTRDHARGFLEEVIPYASQVEQMGVRRLPVGLIASGCPAARAYAALWVDIQERIGASSASSPSRKLVRSLLEDLRQIRPSVARRKASARKASARKAATRKAAVRKTADRQTEGPGLAAPEAVALKPSAAALEPTTPEPPTASPRSVQEGLNAPGPAPPPAPVPDPGAGPDMELDVTDMLDEDGPQEVEFKIRVEGFADFEAIAREAGAGGPLPDGLQQVNHFFDTPGLSLHGASCILRLREEGDNFLVTAKSPSTRSADGTLSVRREEEVSIDAARARQILAGRLSPLDALRSRHGGDSPLTRSLDALIDDAELREVGSFRNLRRRLGPLPLPLTDGGSMDVVFEFDRTEFPGGRVDHEVEVELKGADTARCHDALQQLFARAGVAWRSAPSKSARFFGSLGRESA